MGMPLCVCVGGGAEIKVCRWGLFGNRKGLHSLCNFSPFPMAFPQDLGLKMEDSATLKRQIQYRRSTGEFSTQPLIFNFAMHALCVQWVEFSRVSPLNEWN